MTTELLKKEIHRLVESTDDLVLLKIVFEKLKDIEQPSEPNWWDTLTDEQQEELDRAEEDIKDPNNLIPHEEVMRVFRAQLAKRPLDKLPDWWDELQKP